MKELLKIMNKIKLDLGLVEKDGVNPHYKSSYATLKSVYNLIGNKFTENGLNVFQFVGQSVCGDKIYPHLKTVITHIETGQQLEACMPLVGVANMQNLGSAITYARRYSLITLFDIKEEDDDGNAASNINNKNYSECGKVVNKENDPFRNSDSFIITRKRAV